MRIRVRKRLHESSAGLASCPDYPSGSSSGMGSAFGSISIMCMRSSFRISSVPCFGTCGAIAQARVRTTKARFAWTSCRNVVYTPRDLFLPAERSPFERLVLPHVTVCLLHRGQWITFEKAGAAPVHLQRGRKQNCRHRTRTHTRHLRAYGSTRGQGGQACVQTRGAGA